MPIPSPTMLPFLLALCICVDLINTGLPPLGSTLPSLISIRSLKFSVYKSRQSYTASVRAQESRSRRLRSPPLASIIGTLHNIYASAAKQGREYTKSSTLSSFPQCHVMHILCRGALKAKGIRNAWLGSWVSAAPYFFSSSPTFLSFAGTERAKLLFIDNLPSVVSHSRVIPNK